MSGGNVDASISESELRKAQKAAVDYLKAREESQRADAEYQRRLIEGEKAEEEFHKTYAEYRGANSDVERARTYPDYQKAYEDFMNADTEHRSAADRVEVASRKAEEEWAAADGMWHKVDVRWEEKLLNGDAFFTGVAETEPLQEPITPSMNKTAAEAARNQPPEYSPVGKYWDCYPDLDRRFIHAVGEEPYEDSSAEKNPTASRRLFHENETQEVQDLRQASTI